MRRPDVPERNTPRQRYASLRGFYAADEQRARSRELDVGLWWRERPDGPLHRAAWVSDTGELYLVRLGPAADGGGRVELLATVADGDRLERALEGWRERCGEPYSLTWLRQRASALPSASRKRTSRTRLAVVGAAVGAGATFAAGASAALDLV
jgi:hypothetical protein